jgi:hypothetical protein
MVAFIFVIARVASRLMSVLMPWQRCMMNAPASMLRDIPYETVSSSYHKRQEECFMVSSRQVPASNQQPATINHQPSTGGQQPASSVG